MKKMCLMGCSMLLALSLAACGSGTKVYVQSVQTLAGMGGIAPGDRFAGIVVSENVTEVKKDPDMAVAELLVKEGDDVEKDQKLFTYDTESLQLNLDKQKLEFEQLEGSITSYNSQIKQLEQERSRVGEAYRLKYTLEIQTLQLDVKEAEIKLSAKEKEIARSEELLANAEVISPIRGRIQSINENGTNQNGEEAAYITIQQVGSYRIKGILGELQRGAIREGDKVSILSRTDDTQSWSGSVTLVDYENPSQGSEQDRYYGMAADEMTASSRYPFYVEPDNTDGLMLGQHVYMEMQLEEGELPGVGISSSFVCYDEDGTAFVWAENGSKLEKRPVTLGEYNPMNDIQSITSGISESDYIAFPDPELCVEGASTTREAPQVEEPQEEGGTP